MSSLVRCRVRDLVASCFYACRFPLEEEPDSQRSKRPQIPKKPMFLDSKKARKKTSIMKKTRNEQGGSVKNSSRNNNWVEGAEPSFAEEDYIVFCFREDGEIHMINECKSSQAFHANINTNPISKKVHCGERIRSWDYGRKGEDETKDEEIPISDAKDDDYDDDENGNKENEINRVEDVDFEQKNAQKMESFESCDSNLSDTSTNSFAFPVLSIEWMGSPVHMPRSENHQMCLHCCRF